MPSTPLLAITQVSNSQNSKEVTINDAILALEGATNGNKPISFAASPTYTLTTTEATRSFIFRAQAATAASTLNFPIAINGAPYNRVIAVRNESGQSLTVKFATGAGSTVVVPNGQSRLIAALDGLNMIVAAEPGTAVSFVSLADTPDTLAGMQGKFLTVNAAGDELEFVNAAVFPAYALNAGKALVVNATEDGVEWVTIETITSFAALTDTPATYASAGGKLVAVKGDETGLEFVELPSAEAVEFRSATQWRIRVVQGGLSSQVGFGEIEFQNVNGLDETGTGVADASNFDVGKEAEFAFDGNFDFGNGWLTEATFVGVATIDYTFPATKVIRKVKLWPINGFPADFTPMRFFIEYYNGAVWVEAGEHVAAPWVDGVPQSFLVNGFALQSVADAANDGETYVRRNNAWEPIGNRAVPVGGTTGQALVKNSDNDRDAEWADLPTGIPGGGTTGQALVKKTNTDGDVEFVDPRRLFTSVIQLACTDPNGAALAPLSGVAFLRISSAMNGMTLTAVAAAVSTPSTSGPVTVALYNATTAVNMLAVNLTIDANEGDSASAATPVDINEANDTVVTGHLIRIDVMTAGTGAKGLIVELQFQLLP